MTNETETATQELNLQDLDAVIGGATVESFEPNCRKAGGQQQDIIAI
jgi:hypothetical protein